MTPRALPGDRAHSPVGHPHPIRHPIDPKIDCVFQALLGAECNRALLAHFLNPMLAPELPAPVVQVVILNPYNEREFLDDKPRVVDVKARDAQGQRFQIDIQLPILPVLPARILYGWPVSTAPNWRAARTIRG